LWENLGGFTYQNNSIFDSLTKHAITWRLYRDDTGPLLGQIPQVASLKNIHWRDVHTISTFQEDIKSQHYPYQYTFIEPSYGDIVSGTYEGGSSQHPMDGTGNGEALIAKVYESIRSSPVWNSSMLIIIYDEHGGFYDHMAPGDATPPGDTEQYNHNKFPFNKYGVRIPAVIVSPWFSNQVDHTIYDHTSVLATIEWLFGLPHLTNRDKNAHIISFVKTPLSTPRKDCPTKLPLPHKIKHHLNAEAITRNDWEEIPEKSSLFGFLHVVLKAESTLFQNSQEAQLRFQQVKTRGDARRCVNEVMTKVNQQVRITSQQE